MRGLRPILPAVVALLMAGMGSVRAAAPTPAGWPAPIYDGHDGPTTPAGFELGRRLFYDARLSRDGSVACASCHQQAAAFAHPRHRVSHGVDGRLGTRNAPALFNLAWQPDFMWDGSVAHLEFQPLAPIANKLEMDQDVAGLVARLAADPDYPAAFARAFGSPGIDAPRMLHALAQFLSALVSADSRYDRVAAGRARFTPVEAHGHAVFAAQCAACHAEPLFTDFSYRGNGLDATPPDAGRGAITGRPEDRGRFRVPSLRNVALTAPYMHDGRFDTLDAVLDHYDHGVQPSAALDPRLAGGIHLSADDRAALLAFLGTLTDEGFVHDARFAEPRPPAATAVAAASPSFGDRLADLMGAAAQAHEGHEHGDDHDDGQAHAPVAAPDPATPHLALSVPPYELVAQRDHGTLIVYLDDYATNAPIVGADLTVRAGGAVLRAAERGDGLYAVPADRIPADSAQTISFQVRAARGAIDVQGTLPADTVAATASLHRRPWWGVAALLALALVIVGGLAIIGRRRRAAS